jgi:hypothetical protein
LFRVHGSVAAGTHTPWSYDPETLRTYEAMAALHRRAAPLILRLWAQADRNGIPPTRPLWLEFPGDAAAARQDQEWMLGHDVLVAPVVAEGATSRDVYFPAGCWVGTGMRVTGPANRTIAAPLGTLPYFTRCGTDPFEGRSCVRRRQVTIRVPRGTRRVRVIVEGRRVRARRRGRRLVVPLRKTPAGTLHVRVVERLRSGRTRTVRRTYSSCVRR